MKKVGLLVLLTYLSTIVLAGQHHIATVADETSPVSVIIISAIIILVIVIVLLRRQKRKFND